MCEFNSCRSQLAEGLARSIVPAEWRVLSAGLTRTGVSTEVVTALDEIAIDCRAQSSKSLADLRQEHIDDVFVLAPPALEAVRTMFPTATLWEWPMDDPLHTPGGRDRVRAAVCSARDELKRRLQDWLTHDAHKR